MVLEEVSDSLTLDGLYGPALKEVLQNHTESSYNMELGSVTKKYPCVILLVLD